METLRPFAPAELAAMIREAGARGRTLAVQGAGSKAGLGRPVDADARLDLSALTGIIAYEPDELVLTARPGTPLSAIEATLRAKGQMLAFEPPDFGAFYGAAGRATLGGTVAAGLSGPRRRKAGAVRDHLLGFAGVNGRGEAIKAGGRVMKNVTGYDLPKLIAGSFGTLAVLTELTLRVSPAPQSLRTLLVRGLPDAAGLALLRAAAAHPAEPAALVHLPAETAAASAVDALALPRRAATLIRVEGPADGLGARLAALRGLAGRAETAEIGPEISAVLWRELREAAPLFDSADTVWRVMLPPAQAASLAPEIAPRRWFYDRAGALVWLAVAPSPGADAGVVRRAADRLQGEALLVRAEPAVRARVPVFPPLGPGVAALTAGVKAAFDPGGVLNPGRMFAGI